MSRPGGFWARRRAAVQAEEAAEQRARQEAEEARERAVQEEKTDEELLEELNLPEPESLKAGDDFSAFMAKAVPERLRQRALRTLWRSNPALANLDNLVDYNDDYTAAATANGPVRTSYQVGKGMMKHLLHTAPEDQDPGAAAALHDADDDGHRPENPVNPATDSGAADGAQSAGAMTDAEPRPGDRAARDETPDQAGTRSGPGTEGGVFDAAETGDTVGTRRRMRFAFEG